jgi:glycosyltransferase involved in cell wall biosynthesis
VNGTRAGDPPFVVVPAFREAPRIAAVVGELVAGGNRVVVVDDGSPDATGAIARAAGATVLRHVINRGQGAALQTGITWALAHGARCVVTYDADGQHRAADLPALLAPIRAGTHDFAFGSRFLGRAEGIPRLRRLVLAAAVRFSRLASGLRVSDAHNGLRAFSRRGAASLAISLDRMAHASELLDQVRDSGLPWTEVPVAVRYTRESIAKGQGSTAAVRILFDYLFARWFR